MKKTVQQIITQVAKELNLPVPQTVVTSTNQNVQKLFGFLTAVSDDLLYEYSWQDFQLRYELTTVDGQESYPWPEDIQRFISGTFFDGTNQWPWAGPLTPGQWEWLKTGFGTVGPYSRFRVFQDKIWLMPIPGDGQKFFFEYISNAYVMDDTGERKNEYTEDSDVCLFDHRVVVYGIKLKYLESISQDTSAALADYGRALEFAKAQDTPGPTLSLNGTSYWDRLINNANIRSGNFGSY